MQPEAKNSFYLSRRKFLQWSSLAGAELLLNACGKNIPYANPSTAPITETSPPPEKFLEMKEITGAEYTKQKIYLDLLLPQALSYSLITDPDRINPAFAKTYKTALENMCYLWGYYTPEGKNPIFYICNGFILNDTTGRRHLATAYHNLLLPQDGQTSGLLSFEHKGYTNVQAKKGLFFKSVGSNSIYQVTTNHFLTTGDLTNNGRADTQGTALFPIPNLLGSRFTGFTAAESYNGKDNTYCLRPDLNLKLDLTPATPMLPTNIFTYYNQVNNPPLNILCRGVSGTAVLNAENKVTGYLSNGEEIIDDGCAYSLYARNVAQYELDGEYNSVFV